VQKELKAKGDIERQGFKIDVLDRVSDTRGRAANPQLQSRPGPRYPPDLPSQGLQPGDRGTITSVARGRVKLEMADDCMSTLEPDRLPRNLHADALSLYTSKSLLLHQGECIRWISNDGARDLLNGDIATVEAIANGSDEV
jgi:hypothetical protein